jgi:hypothetical protein
MDQALINRIVEAALLASNLPLTLPQLHGLFPEDDPPPPGSVERLPASVIRSRPTSTRGSPDFGLSARPSTLAPRWKLWR